MTSAYNYPTEYFLQEGRENLGRCIHATFEAAATHNIKKVIIFTAAGLGVKMAIQDYLSLDKYADIELIAVTFSSQTQFSTNDPSEYTIPGDVYELLANQKVPIVRAHLPFDPIRTQFSGHGVLGQDFSLIGNALRIFCGSMSLCVQAVLMASDAGHVALGEHVIAMTSDTSILVRAAGTSRFLTDLIVREIICKPVLLTIGKSERAEYALIDSKETATDTPELLPPE
ncbi:MAG: hypothetical protein ABR906_00350 [Terracidiphilus sp.]|jgi:hypothetical protein